MAIKILAKKWQLLRSNLFEAKTRRPTIAYLHDEYLIYFVHALSYPWFMVLLYDSINYSVLTEFIRRQNSSSRVLFTMICMGIT